MRISRGKFCELNLNLAVGNFTERVKIVEAGKVVRLTAEEWEAERNKMIKICSQCHSPSFAKEQLEKADQVIKESDKLMAEAIEIVESLYKDGILERPKDYPLHTDLLRFSIRCVIR